MPTPVGNEGSHTIDGLTVKGGLAIMGQGASNVAPRTSYMTPEVLAAQARNQLFMEARGWYAETIPNTAAGATSGTNTSGTIYAQAIALLAGDVVTNIIVPIQTGFTTSSGVHKVGLLSSLPGASPQTMTLLGSSADQVGSWNAQGLYVVPLTTPVTITTSTMYYIGIISIATTAVATAGSSAASFVSRFSTGASSFASSGLLAGQTDMVGGSYAMTAGSSRLIWFGVS
jgi:hypothetical protein